MNTFFMIVGIFYLIVLYFFIDFSLGRKIHLEKLKLQHFPDRHSDIRLFTSGPELFADLFSELKEAQKHIHVLFYIVKKDHISTDFLSLFKKKADEGVEVRLMLDWVGSFKAKRSITKELQGSRVQLIFCKAPRPPFFFYSSQIRNHRKITVIDGKIGYLGGFNIGKEYINLDSKLSPWRDYHLKIVGEGVQDLQVMFLRDWEEAAMVRLTQNKLYFPDLEKGKYRHRIIPSEGFYLEHTFSELINSAKDCIMIGTPYFIPGKRLLQDLQAALKRGVKLEILVPSTPDHLLVKEASYRYFRPLLDLGASIYQYQNGFYHSKILIIDDRVCDVGTANFDKRSFFLNHEMNCYTYDPSYVESIRGVLKQDQAEAKLISKKDISMLNPWTFCKEMLARSISLFL
ncbi:cardiolipin synthase [Bacillus tuaregi]|uniref:cardiolipin synthase n=1 Tax=Bacillus tuaregi TaxID=1816695 RepID=UPI0008F85E4D|nr:cardiolipin synthase [Bacillus tuaregi]